MNFKNIITATLMFGTLSVIPFHSVVLAEEKENTKVQPKLAGDTVYFENLQKI